MPEATVTDLSAIGTPGGVFTFSPKAAAAPSATLITDLSVMGVPGPTFTFAAKTPAVGGGIFQTWRGAFNLWHRSSS